MKLGLTAIIVAAGSMLAFVTSIELQHGLPLSRDEPCSEDVLLESRDVTLQEKSIGRSRLHCGVLAGCA